MAKERVGLYPGTFDPITNGHLDIIQRATTLVDRLVIGVAINPGKSPAFSLEERTEMVVAETAGLAGDTIIEVRPFNALLMHFADEVGAQTVIRGLRSMTDFEYEFQMVGMNAHLNPDVETIFLLAHGEHQAIASKLVREIAMFGGDITAFVPARVAEKTVARMKERS
jgi:pantetheine-phosphate adenylyltransferase